MTSGYLAITLNIENEAAPLESRLVDVVEGECSVSIRREGGREGRRNNAAGVGGSEKKD